MRMCWEWRRVTASGSRVSRRMCRAGFGAPYKEMSLSEVDLG